MVIGDLLVVGSPSQPSIYLNKTTHTQHYECLQNQESAASLAVTNGGGPAARRPPVLLMHALMQDSEAFLCGGEHSLALFLADLGYDVWLGETTRWFNDTRASFRLRGRARV